MHTWQIIAFILAAAATVLAGTQKAWWAALTAAALAAWFLPAAFQLTT